MAHTPGPWRISENLPGSVVSDHPTGRPLEADPFVTEGGVLIPDDFEAYGGYLVCESVLPKDKPLIAAAPEMFETLRLAEAWIAAPLESHQAGLIVPPDADVPGVALARIRDVLSRIEEAEAEEVEAR
jgi:hypothetical protein